MISVILYGRNDSHGYNLHKRAAISLNCIAEVLTHENDEIIFVDCNTPDDMPTFPESIHDTLTEKVKSLMHIFRLRPDLYNKHKKGSHLNALEPLSRNIGIRRTNPKNRWIFSTNTDMVFIPRIEGKSLSDIVAKIPDGFYELPRYEVPEALWETVDRANPQEIIKLFAHWGQRLHINNAVISNPYIRYDGPGDFQLILREQAFAIQGFNEDMVLGWHLDSNIAKRLNLLNGCTESLLDKVFAYHCDHTRQATLMHGPKRKENDLKKFFDHVKSPYLPQQAETWGLPKEEIEEIVLNKNYINRFSVILHETLPGLSVPYTEDMFGSSIFYNHGLIYDNNHVIPYLTDHFCAFKPEWNYGYFGSNLDLLKRIDEVRIKLNHKGKIFYCKELFNRGGIKDLSQLPESCVASELDFISAKSDIFLFDAGMNSFPIQKKDGVPFPQGSKLALNYTIIFYNTFIKVALYENNIIKEKKNPARKFLLIASQCTWFESVSVQLIGVLFAPFSGRVRTGFMREEAFEYPLFPPSLDAFIGSTEILEDLSKVLNRKVTFEEYYTAGIRLQEWIGLYNDEEAFSKKLMRLSVTEIDFALLNCRAEICQLIGQQELSDVIRKMSRILGQLYPEVANRIKDYMPNLWKTSIKDFIEAETILKSAKDKEPEKGDMLNILLHAPLYDPSGYADESRNILFGLDSLGINISAVPLNWNNNKAKLSLNELDRLNELTILPDRKQEGTISLFNIFPKFYKRVPYADYHIGRTMFETDRIPQDWVDACNMMDEIWVPSEFNINTFSLSGVDKNKLVKIPESIDVAQFDLNAEPLDIPGKKKFCFLSVFDWSFRKGWDILLRGFIEEFRSDKDVCLIIKTWSSYGKSLAQIKEEAKLYLNASGIAEDIPANVIFIEANLSTSELSKLYRSANAFVLPTRGEGWGRPFMEAMLMKLPVIGTRWSGQLEFMNDNNSFLIDCTIEDVSEAAWKEIPTFKGHKWAKPSLNHLRKLMRHVFETEPKQIAENAHLDICNNFNRSAVTNTIFNRLKEIHKKLDNASKSITVFKKIEHNEEKKTAKSDLFNIIWEGPQLSCSSLALINREHCKRLINDGFSISLLNNENDKNLLQLKDISFPKELKNKVLSQVDFYISHQFPPNLIPPENGYWIIIQPWEFGSLPKDWVEVFSEKVNELWVPSSYVRQVYIDSGIPAEKVFVIPNGFDPDKFNYKAKPYKLKTKKKLKFLFVGGTIYRKGIDLLLDTYVNTFKKSDNVCLVIKDMGSDSFYKGQSCKEKILEIIKTPGTPEIVYIDKILSEKQIAGLYTACDVLVHPYRGEGFGLPVLEAMACGLPVIVTEGGACNDFCNTENSIFVKAEKTFYKDKKVGDFETVSNPWLYEPSADDLKNKMIGVYKDPTGLKDLGKKAYEYVHNNFTWDKAYNKLKERIDLITKKDKPIDDDFENDLFSSAFNQFLVACETDNYDAAAELIVKAFEYYPISKRIGYESIDYSDLLNLAGSIFLILNNLEEAQKYFEEELNNDPGSARACIGLGEIFFTAEMYNEAKMMFEWAVNYEPNNNAAALGLAKVNRQLGFSDLHSNLQVQEYNPEKEIIEAEELIKQDNFDGAQLILENILQKCPENLDALNNLAVARILKGEHNKALDLIEKVLEIDENNEIALENLKYLSSVFKAE